MYNNIKYIQGHGSYNNVLERLIISLNNKYAKAIILNNGRQYIHPETFDYRA